MTTHEPASRTSDPYLAENGKEYFAWQRDCGIFAWNINAQKYQ